ncbi:MAG: ABC transporter ATP-binding protein [Thermocaproicibacter melissae]|jgi:ABC-2 type transport system ATP-binding protein|uniref:ATP-binding cassette domain-containing protein n=1 Tax=Thermocaproicibacter melissae TaxID=2966552 RepID=UPI0024B13049|nr:ATP-binding cassette domain-containing protein [Thermocaproicibacter melissae]WBY64896.1 ATP-binding cassette domain-containing protein [Thermocaproicibacter melissae]
MSETVIQTKNITKRYGKFAAVSDLSIRVNRGDIYALVGQNGAGKTTLLKLITGLTPRSSGELELFGHSSERGLEMARNHMGSMIETPSFFPYLSARENLEYYRIQRGGKNKGNIESALRIVGLDKTGNKKFKNFSLGMKQRLGLALAIMDNPEVLILDEPINGLDPMGIKEFREIILKLNKEKKTTILISSHILGELSQIATTYGFISKGSLVEAITAEELKEKCRTYLQIDVDNVQLASEILRNNCSCENFEVVGENSIHVNENFDSPELFVKALVEGGVVVSQVYRAGISLEQYFIKLMGVGQNA